MCDVYGLRSCLGVLLFAIGRSLFVSSVCCWCCFVYLLLVLTCLFFSSVCCGLLVLCFVGMFDWCRVCFMDWFVVYYFRYWLVCCVCRLLFVVVFDYLFDVLCTKPNQINQPRSSVRAANEKKRRTQTQTANNNTKRKHKQTLLYVVCLFYTHMHPH